jgi:biopolymer transport protein ExbD
MTAKTLAKVGLVAAILAVTLSWGTDHWLKMRTHELINRPVSIEKGVLNSGPFVIEHEESYWFEMELDSSVDDWFRGSCDSKDLHEADWRMYRLDKRELAKTELWISSEWFYGPQRGFAYEFTPSVGKYWLRWDAPYSADCLNARHLRLRIWTVADEDEFLSVLIQDACLFFGGMGVVFVILGRSSWIRGNLAEEPAPRMFPEMKLRSVIPRKRHRPLPLICDMSNFRVVWGGVLFMFATFFATVTTLERNMIGLPVDFREQKALGVEKSPWTETVSVYVDAQRGYLVNGHPVRREVLQAELKRELGRQMVWTVYLEADLNCSFEEVVHAMDTIQGLGAKLVWITPKTREEWKQKSIR